MTKIMRNGIGALLSLSVTVSLATVIRLADATEVLQPGPSDASPGATDMVLLDVVNAAEQTASAGAFIIAEGDILVGRIDPSTVGSTPVLAGRGLARLSKLDRWLNGRVFYEISPALAASDIAKIDEAVGHWNEHTSISLIQRSDESIQDYILFEPASGCASWVGRIGGAQTLWVGPDCTSGSIIHEIGHAVGLFHEHTRSDRDNFIGILWDNVTPGKEFNFDILDDGIEPVGDYDYGSIMHYGTHYFSHNGQPTIQAPDGITIGQRDALSVSDIATVDQMYGTDLSLSVNRITTDDNNTQLDISVTNAGTSGAHGLAATVALNGASVIAIDSGDWTCNTDDIVVDCNSEILSEDSQSLFSITVDFDRTARIDLYSRTYDTDPFNNQIEPLEASPDVPEESEDTVPSDLLDAPVTAPENESPAQQSPESEPTTNTSESTQPDQTPAVESTEVAPTETPTDTATDELDTSTANTVDSGKSTPADSNASIPPVTAAAQGDIAAAGATHPILSLILLLVVSTRRLIRRLDTQQ